MDWIERLNKSIHYIEDHLTDEIDIGQLARIAYLSLPKNVHLYGRHHFIGIYPKKENVFGSR